MVVVKVVMAVAVKFEVVEVIVEVEEVEAASYGGCSGTNVDGSRQGNGTCSSVLNVADGASTTTSAFCSNNDTGSKYTLALSSDSSDPSSQRASCEAISSLCFFTPSSS
jgi:hypothetical protein